MKGWADHRKNPDGTKTIFQGGVINSQRGLERAKQKIPAEAANSRLRMPLHRHHYGRALPRGLQSRASVDAFSGSPLQNGAARILFARQEAVVGTETGIDPSSLTSITTKAC